MPRRHRARNGPDLVEPIVSFIGLVAFCLVFLGWINPVFRGAMYILLTVAVFLFVAALICVVSFFAIRWFIRSRQEVPAVTRCIDLSRLEVQTVPLPATWPADTAEASGQPAILLTTAPWNSGRTLAEQLHQIDWFQFEKLLEAAYRARGYGVERRGGAKADGGIDLVITKEGETIAVQCKHWKKWVVRVRLVREMIGALKVAGIQKAIIITLKGFTNDAQSLAAEHGIQILTEKDVLALLESVGAHDDALFQELLNDQRKFCPRCEGEMVLRTATRGLDVGKTFWGCSRFPRCKYILRAE